jgi:transposase
MKRALAVKLALQGYVYRAIANILNVSQGYIAFIRKMRYDITDLNGVKNIEPQNVMQL